MSEAGVSAPIMPSRDLDATIAYYARLGFEIWGERMEDYILLRRGSWELHFFLWPEHDPAACYCAVYRRGEDVDELSQLWSTVETSREGIPRLIPVEDKPWGMRELALIDPDGNLLRVGQAV